MPDKKTVYSTDDTESGGLFKFVADTAGDLTEGQNYCAKFTQTQTSNDDFTADIAWIAMPKASSAQVEAAIQTEDFSSLFETRSCLEGGSCPTGFTPVFQSGVPGVGVCECLQPRANMEKLAAALEKRRYAAWLGCTTDFNAPVFKAITFDAENRKMYAAAGSMADTCGCVLEVEVDSSMHAVSTKTLVCGKTSDESSQCDVTGPDNVALISEYQQLLIGEGDNENRNNLLWVYDLPSGDLTRVASVPTGAGATSPYWFTVGPWSYISMGAPHPEGDDAYVGYVGPFPRKSGMNWMKPIATWTEMAYPSGFFMSATVVHSHKIVIDSHAHDEHHDDHHSHHTFHAHSAIAQEIGPFVSHEMGDRIGHHVMGRIVTHKDSPLHFVYEYDDAWQKADTELVSKSPDEGSILNVDGKIFMVTNYQARPGGAYLSELEQDSKTGKLTVKETKPVEFSNHGGLWMPSAGAVTPWETHLGAEQNEPDARAFYDDDLSVTAKDDVSEFLRYFGAYVNPAAINLAQATQKGFFPYRYGYAWETVVSAGFTEETTKLYALGRQSYKGLHVMPDKKTVYSTDDTESGGLFKFVADTAGDLTEGQNYCAKFTQTSVEDSAAVDFTADISWWLMPKASSAQVKEAIETETFNTLFQAATCAAGDSPCEAGFKPTNIGGGCECLKPIAGKHHLAAALEKRRYAAWLGCTTEFTGLKGITFDAESMTIYTSIAAVDGRMEHGFSELGTADHISLTGNSCGCIMAIDVDHGFSGTFARMLVCGDNTDNGCSTKTISNPDDVAMIPEYRQLMIGEDRKPAPESNSLLWIYDLDLGGATRIASVALPAEENSFSRAMAPSWFTVGRWSYVGVVASFVGGSSSWLHQSHVVPHGADQATAQVGYLGPIPSIRPGHVPTYHWGRFPMCICCRNQICFVPHKVFDFAALGSVIASWTSTGLKSVLLKR
jgi:secreted PhoX family phosphatase